MSPFDWRCLKYRLLYDAAQLCKPGVAQKVQSRVNHLTSAALQRHSVIPKDSSENDHQEPPNPAAASLPFADEEVSIPSLHVT